MSEKTINPGLKAALDFGPLVVFFLGYFWLKDASLTLGGQSYSGLLVMAAAFAAMTAFTTAILYFATGRLSPVQVLTLVVVVVMAGMSLWLKDERFFKMKPTVIEAAFAIVLFVGLMRGKSYLQVLLDNAIPLQHEGWMILTRRYAIFFAGLAVANEVVWRNFSTEIWVDFKVFGILGLTVVFILTQAKLMSRYALPEGEKKE